MPNVTTPALVRQLLMYAQANPNASDSAQGIARWWLDPKESVNLQALEEALDFLVSRGAFAERLGADGRRSYRRICSDFHLQQLLAQAQTRCVGRGKRAGGAGA